jgi:hypothetical protein
MAMIYEMRTYRLKTGTLATYLKLVEEEGIAIQKSYLGELVGYFFSEIGALNQRPRTATSSPGAADSDTPRRACTRVAPDRKVRCTSCTSR